MFSKNKLGVYFFLIAIIIALVNPFLITNPNIDNADPSSYIIVPLIMLPLLAAFVFKKQIIPKVERADIAVGVAAFVIFIALVLALQLLLPYYFLSYRIDMLLFPVAIASFAIILFGIKNILRFKPLFVYPLLASPLLFVYLLGLNNSFAQANTVFVYNILHLFSSKIIYLPPFSISTGNYAIGIGTACAGIVVFIALMLFLIPIAYLLEGKNRRKIYWVASGFGLLVLLNFLRMSVIAGIWLLYGPNFATSFVHGFAGILLFYIAIIAMVLLAGKFGLLFPKIGREKSKKESKGGFRFEYLLVVLLALSYFFISSSYLSANILPASSLLGTPSYNFTSASLTSFASGFGNDLGWNISISPSSSASLGVLVLSNRTFNYTSPVLMLISNPNRTLLQNITRNLVLDSYTFVNIQGARSTLYKIETNQSVLFVSVKQVPYLFPNGYAQVMVYTVIPNNSGVEEVSCSGSYDAVYTYILNLVIPSSVKQGDMTGLVGAYCISSRFV